MLAKNVLYYLYSQPINVIQSIAAALNVSAPTVLRLLNDFVRLEILVELTGFKRNRVFAFEQFFKIIQIMSKVGQIERATQYRIIAKSFQKRM